MRILHPLLSGLVFAALACGDSGGGETGGTGDTSGATSEPTTTTMSPTAGEPLSCDVYCEAITANCVGADAQYADNGLGDNGLASCKTACMGLPEGVSSDMSGNTLGCRTYHADASAGDPATHCRHAGPGGDATCGPNCAGFCSIAVSVCGTTYISVESCMTECLQFPDDVEYSTTQTGGNTLACRLYHLTAAAVDAAAATIHCPHIVGASPVCTPPPPP
jgi:hypothetical protein